MDRNRQPTGTPWVYMQHLFHPMQDQQQPQQQQQQQPPPQHSPQIQHHQQYRPAQQQLPQHSPQLQHHAYRPTQQYRQPQQQQYEPQHHQYRQAPVQPQPQHAKPTFSRPEEQRYSVESLLATPPRPEQPPPPTPSPQHSHPHPHKEPPDNEMMVMSFLNELEGVRKVQEPVAGGPTSSQHKSISPVGEMSFPQVMLREDPMLPEPHLSRGTSHPASGDARSTAVKQNHHGDTTSHSKNVEVLTNSLDKVPRQQDHMAHNPLDSGICEGPGNSMRGLERGDSVSSVSQLDLGLGSDHNSLIDQLESALDSDSSLQASPSKTSMECVASVDAPSCMEGVEEAGQVSTHPQTSVLTSLPTNTSPFPQTGMPRSGTTSLSKDLLAEAIKVIHNPSAETGESQYPATKEKILPKAPTVQFIKAEPKESQAEKPLALIKSSQAEEPLALLKSPQANEPIALLKGSQAGEPLALLKGSQAGEPLALLKSPQGEETRERAKTTIVIQTASLFKDSLTKEATSLLKEPPAEDNRKLTKDQVAGETKHSPDPRAEENADVAKDSQALKATEPEEDPLAEETMAKGPVAKTSAMLKGPVSKETRELAKDLLSETTNKDPLAETTSKGPVAETTNKDPLAEASAKDPVAETTTKDTVAETTAKGAVAETTPKGLLAETTAKNPLAETTAEGAVAETTAKDPLAETTAKDPVAETTVKSPVTRSIAKDTLAEETTAFHPNSQGTKGQASKKFSSSPVEKTFPLQDSLHGKPSTSITGPKPISISVSSSSLKRPLSPVIGSGREDSFSKRPKEMKNEVSQHIMKQMPTHISEVTVDTGNPDSPDSIVIEDDDNLEVVIDTSQKKVDDVVPFRKPTKIIEATQVPPKDLKVMCYVCDTNVSAPFFKHHLFFGYVRCFYCSRWLNGCRLLQEDLNDPRKKVCLKSPDRAHNFTKYSTDPIEFLSYQIRKELVIKGFCAGKGGPPGVPEIVEEIRVYAAKLSCMEQDSPWCHALEKCYNYIEERNRSNNSYTSPSAQQSSSTFSHSILGSRFSSGSSSPVLTDISSKSSISETAHMKSSLMPVQAAPVKESVQPTTFSSLVPSPIILVPDQASTSTQGTPVTQSEAMDDSVVMETDPTNECLPRIESVNSSHDLPASPSAGVEDSALFIQPLTDSTSSSQSEKDQNSAAASVSVAALKSSPADHIVKVKKFKASSQPEASKASSQPEGPSQSVTMEDSASSSQPAKVTKTKTTHSVTARKSTFSHRAVDRDSTLTSEPESSQESTSLGSQSFTKPSHSNDSGLGIGELDSSQPVTRQSIAGTTLVRQWGTKTKVHTKKTSTSKDKDKDVSLSSENGHYLFVKYPSEPVPDTCPSCYTEFDTMKATVKSTSFLITVPCQSCSLILYLCQEAPPRSHKKRRRL